MQPFLSGTAACGWYIKNQEVDEIENFYLRYI
jgi:hypothetical protein